MDNRHNRGQGLNLTRVTPFPTPSATTRMSQEWDMPFDQVVQIYIENHEASKARRSSAGKPAGPVDGRGFNPVESVEKRRSSRGSGCLGLGSWGNKSSHSQPCSLASSSRKSEHDRHAHGPDTSSGPVFVSSGGVEKDVCASTASVFLVEKLEGSDQLTPLQEVRKAISAPSNASVGMGTWSSRSSGTAIRVDISPSAMTPQQRVSVLPFLPESTDVAGGSPGESHACTCSSDHRLPSTCPSQGTPSCSSGPRSSVPPPPNPDCSTKFSDTRSCSSAGTYFFQGTLERSRRGSNSDKAFPSPEHSEAGDGEAAREEDLRVAGREGSLVFYHFAKSFDLGLEGEELQLYACRPPGDEGDAAIVDNAGFVVQRVKRGAGKHARRRGYMLEDEQIERCCVSGGVASTESWPVKLANAIVAIPPRFPE